jgi:hypothetical protein
MRWIIPIAMATLALCLAVCVNMRTGNSDADMNAAIKIGDTARVERLIAEGVDVNAYDGLPLFVAAKNGHTEIAELLIKAGADVNADGGLPLYVAEKYGHTKTAEMLKKYIERAQ